MVISLDKKMRTIIGAFFVRIIVLLIIILLIKEIPAFGFMGNSPDYDDYRYDQGAVLYSQDADSIVDIQTFTRIYDNWGDWTGHHLSDPLRWGWLWYWICCILVYITKTRWSIRILNIFLAIFTVKYIYDAVDNAYSRNAAEIAARLWAFLPYPVIFSCFAYKDSLVAFCLTYLISKFVKIKKDRATTKGEIIGIVIVSTIFIFTRSGLSELFIAICVFYLFSDQIRAKMNLKYFIAFIVILIIAAAVIWRIWGIVMFKYSAYVTPSATESTGLGSLVKVTSLRDLWKLPLAFVFAILQPIGINLDNLTWYAIVCLLNFLMCPIAIAAVFGIKSSFEYNRSLFWVMMIYYLIVVSTSVLISRHLFSALPIPIIFASNYYTSGSRNSISIYLGMTLLLVIAMIVVFI